MAIRKKIRRALAYWLHGNEELCAGCDRPHAYAVEARCVACDRPQCPVCVIVVEGEIFCSECHPEAEGGRKRWRRARSGKAS